MSFILDALKKAEAERQRQTGPTLLEVRVTPPRRRIPLWTLVIGALLGVNMLLLLVFVLRRPAAPLAAATSAPTATSATSAPAPGSPGQTAATPAPSAAPIPQTNGSVPVPALQGVSPADPGAVTAAAAGAAVPPPTARLPTYPSAVATAPTVSPGPGEMPAAPDVVSRGGIDGGPGGDNPADYEPAVSANGRAAAGSSRGADSGSHAEPPSLSEIGGDLPNLRLDLHVYSTRPADRYALINMHRVHEGDVLPEGPRVVAIQADGVELSYRGQAFMLHPQ